MITFRSLPFAVVIVLASITSSRADLIFTLEPNTNAIPKETVHFQATFTNTGAQDVFLNADSISLFGDWTGLTVNDSYFFSDVPYPLSSGGAWTGVLFDVEVGANATTGTYYGSFYVFGGLDDTTQDQLADPQDFQVTVNAVPEPSSAVILASLLSYGLLFVWRKRRAPRG